MKIRYLTRFKGLVGGVQTKLAETKSALKART